MADLKDVADQNKKGSLSAMKTHNSPRVAFDPDTGKTVELTFKGYEVIQSPWDTEKLIASYDFINAKGQKKNLQSGSNGLAALMEPIAEDTKIILVKTGAGMQTRYNVEKVG